MNILAWLKTLPDEALRSLELREWHDDEVDTYVELLNKHHYLKCPHARKRHLSQVACYQGKAVALIIWTSSSRKLIHRDEYIGWDSRTREKRLRTPLKTYQDRDEYNFDFEQGDSVHRRAGSPSCADTTQLRTKSVSV